MATIDGDFERMLLELNDHKMGCASTSKSGKSEDETLTNISNGSDAIVNPSPLSAKPHAFALSYLAKHGKEIKRLRPVPLQSKAAANKMRVVCISDTHNKLARIADSIPDGDLLIHAGDFTMYSTVEEIQDKVFCRLPHKHKVVIAGNHELLFDEKKHGMFGCIAGEAADEHLRENNVVDVRRLLDKHFIYLQDESVTIMGYKIYGSPWQPKHRNWAFNEHRGKAILEKWQNIPCDTDILVTHGPPVCIGDKAQANRHVGCVDLLNTVLHRIKPQLHIFGHLHESYGEWKHREIHFVNASICTSSYAATNAPIIVDLPRK